MEVIVQIRLGHIFFKQERENGVAWENSKTEQGLDGQSTHEPRGAASENVLYTGSKTGTKIWKS